MNKTSEAAGASCPAKLIQSTLKEEEDADAAADEAIFVRKVKGMENRSKIQDRASLVRRKDRTENITINFENVVRHGVENVSARLASTKKKEGSRILMSSVLF